MEPHLTPAEPSATINSASQNIAAAARDTTKAAQGSPGHEPECRIYMQEGSWLAEIRRTPDQPAARTSYRNFASMESAVAYAEQHRLSYRVHARPLWICTWRKT